jgi:hypothetical protein
MNRLPAPSYASSADEAQILTRLCAEPRPAGDHVKAAVLRASRRLGFSFNRTRDIWYRNAKRIDAEEMDCLRQTAEKVELMQAVASIELLKSKILASRSAVSREIAASLAAAVQALGSDARGKRPEG